MILSLELLPRVQFILYYDLCWLCNCDLHEMLPISSVTQMKGILVIHRRSV